MLGIQPAVPVLLAAISARLDSCNVGYGADPKIFTFRSKMFASLDNGTGCGRLQVVDLCIVHM